MALSTGNKFVIGLSGCLAAAAFGPMHSVTTSTGQIEFLDRFTYGDNDCNIFNTRIGLRDASSGKLTVLDATGWEKKTCGDKNAPQLSAGVQYEIKYDQLLANRLFNWAKPSVQSITLAKPAA